ncbi:class Ib ribonucleoside-diphosphate reductase assembly flavoprotein NrdI [Microbacterium sp. W1N]|uniref:class Ib ribonucleoside-diphosphate reductase assembly flavoprotein NrdI n=1 Tax=Microbacterium festucae TaxID=2977531 RepID=UPI0021BFCE0E|nr:class Ib ribonucleoside-diphosphate reductase assembly flavoprotein NrdI [Microbacterium festucae]MCT9821221.1 class Ib ribonucleoside-diphosphate reductase assembly flavoprotein NrdI [Microbacterium festucae]
MSKVPVYYYSSVSNLTRRFAEHLARQGRPIRDLADAEVRAGEVSGPWVLLTPSYKAGNAAEATLPAPVRRFLRSSTNRRRLIGILGSGNRNFGEYYQAAARELARVSHRPILYEFELAGTPEDVAATVRILTSLDEGLAAGAAERAEREAQRALSESAAPEA